MGRRTRSYAWHVLLRVLTTIQHVHCSAQGTERNELGREKEGGIQALRFVLLHYTHDRDDNPLDALTLDARLSNAGSPPRAIRYEKSEAARRVNKLCHLHGACSLRKKVTKKGTYGSALHILFSGWCAVLHIVRKSTIGEKSSEPPPKVQQFCGKLRHDVPFCP